MLLAAAGMTRSLQDALGIDRVGIVKVDQQVLIVIGVHHPRQRHLLLVAEAIGLGCFETRLAQGRKEHRGKDCDNGDHNQ